MKLKMILVVMSVLCLTALANAQGGSIIWYWYDDGDGPAELPLTDACPGGTPIPDGATIQIFWDNDGNGPDDDDPQPTLCDAPPLCEGGPVGTVNRNQFAMNGEVAGVGPGYFAMESGFASNGGLPPNPQRYYLRLCIGGMRWESSVCTLAVGPREYGPSSYTTPPQYHYTWSCTNTPCAGCQAPSPPQNATASIDRCDGIELTWTYPHQTEDDVEHYLVYRAGTLIAVLDSTIHTYLDTGAPIGQNITYQLAAVRFCGQDSAVSPQVPANGIRPFPPPQPTTMTASDGTCNNVTINWNYSSNQGLDYWAIFRAGALVDTVINDLTPGPRTYVHVGAPGGVAQYCVYGVSNACSLGAPLCDNGEALQPPPQVQNVLASDGLCNVTQITWTDVAGETGYSVTRANSDGSSPIVIASNLVPGTVQFNYTTGACNTVYRFWVTANNTCGGVASVFDTGFMICTPTVPLSFQAADGVNCDMVALTWANASNETYYKIMRGIGSPTDSIGAAAENATSYNDSTAVPGTVYTYAVAAGNACGTSANSTSNTGSRRAPPPQVTGVSATDDNCNNVTITWTNVTGEDSFQVRRDAVRIGVTAVNVTNFVDDLATPGVTYAYTVIAYNACGGIESAPDNGTRPPGLGAPTNVVASDTYCDSIVVTWDNMAGEDSFRVFRNAAQIGRTLQDVTTFTDLTSGAGTFFYTVAAYNVCGQGAMSDPDNGTSGILPGQVTGLIADPGCNDILLNWNAVADADSYVVERDDGRVGAVTITQFTDDPGDGDSHEYTVYAKSECGNGPDSDPVSAAKLTAPGVPANVVATDDRCDSVVVTWDAVATATLYRVLRNSIDIGTTAETRFAHVPTAGETEDYVVSAENDCGAGNASAADDGTRLVAPVAPTTVTASDSTCDGVLVTWSGASGDIDSFRVLREGLEIAMVGPVIDSFFDVFAEIGPNNYTVEAISSECGPSAPSNLAQGTRLAEPGVPANVAATTNSCDDIEITWDASDGDVDGYVVRREGEIVATLGAGVTSYTDVPPAPGDYDYTVEAISDQCDDSGESPAVTGTLAVPPTAAQDLNVTTNLCDRIDLVWEAGTGSIDGYIIFRETNAIDTVDALTLTYSDFGAVVGDNNYYVVAYSESCGNAEASNTEDGTKLEYPTAPTNVVASDTSCSRVYVSWTAIAEPHDYYIVYFDGDSVGTTTDTIFEYIPDPGEVHSYSVKAGSILCGLSPLSNTDDGLRVESANPPANLAASDDDCDVIVVTWNTAEGFVEEYRVYRDGNPVVHATVLPPDTIFEDAVGPGIAYTYQVTAFNSGCGETGLSNQDGGMRQPVLGQVQGAQASTDTCNGIALNWTALIGVTKYYIYRNTVLYDSVNAPNTAYLDVNVLPGESFTYNVTASNECGEGAQSANAVGQRVPLANVVQNVTAVSITCGEIDVAWDNVTGELGYIVLRDDVPVASLGPDITAHTDVVNGEHTYMVLSRNACDTSDASNEATATAPEGVHPVTDVAATDDDCDDVTVTWTESDNATFYSVWRDGNLIQNNIPAGTSSYVDTPPVGTYDYTVAAHNECGQGPQIGPDAGTRLGPPANVTGLAATQDSCNGVWVTWTDLPDEDHYTLLRDTEVLVTLGANVTMYADTPLVPGDYDYQIFADNECGQNATSDPVTGNVPDAPADVPDFAATFDQCGTVTLTWTDVADETSYVIGRNAQPLAIVGQDVTTYVDSPPDFALYLYSVTALNACGESVPSMANGARRDIPTQVTGLVATDNSCADICLAWADPSNEDSIFVFRVQQPQDTIVCRLGPDATSCCDATATPGSHDYYVTAGNICGPAPASATVTGTRLGPPPAVTGVSATDNSSANVTITWTDIADEDGYHVYRDAALIVTLGPDVTSYVDTPAPGTYTYCVAAYNDECGDGTQGCDSGTRLGPPGQVQNVNATDDHCDDIVITWDDLANELGYTISRDGVDIANVGPNTTTYTDTPPPGTYQYRVMAFNGAGPGDLSDPDNGTRLTIPGIVAGVSATDNRCDNITVSWTDVAGLTFKVYRNGTEIANNLNDPPYVDTPAAGTYTYTVSAVNVCGEGDDGTGDSGTRLPAPTAPTNVVASDDGCGQVVVTWTAGTGDIDEYRIERNGTQVGIVTTPPLTFTDNVAAGTYAYTVVSFSSGENCPPAESAPDNGTSHALPSVPTNLAAAAPNCTDVDLTWTASTGEVNGYTVQRDGVTIALTATNSYSDATVNDNLVHTYRVAAYNSFCDTTAFTPTVNGRMRELLLEPTIPATVLCEDTISIDLDHCAGVTSDSIAISLNGGPYQHLITFAPVEDPVDIIIPDTEQNMPNNRLRIITMRGARRDTIFTDPFDIECLAADDPVAEIPTDYILEQNYPNPFNPSTTIRFGLPVTANVTIEIYDVMGRKAGTLISNESLQPGWHNAVWDCSNCPSGMYIVRLQTGDRTMMRKMLLMK